jgi:dihydroorotase
MSKTIIKNATIVNEDEVFVSDLLLENGLIAAIGRDLAAPAGAGVFDAAGLHLLPGLIDDQVHFREPGLTHKGEIYSEAKAAVAGGITSYMEMPNTVPQAVTVDELEKKYRRAAEASLANYSFFMGATNDNIAEIQKADYKRVCGLKIFMGSSTGNMLVDRRETLEKIFSSVNTLIATHCEDDVMIKANQERVVAEYGEDIPAYFHPIIRNDEACYSSSSMAVELARRHGARLHILHISSAKELSLFENKTPLREKRITAEACIHHLWFCDEDYKTKGNLIKWNPAVKTAYDRDKIFEAVLDGRIDVIATDHAPHTIEEKSQPYLRAPSGGPLVQHSLLALLDFYHEGKITLAQIARKTAHNVADIFSLEKRGYIREGYYGDLVLADLSRPQLVNKGNLFYKCNWSPFEGHEFRSTVIATFVNGNKVYHNGHFSEAVKGMRLLFNR